MVIRILTINRYRRKRPKVDASISDSALSHSHRSDVAEKREDNSVSTSGRFRLWTSFESSPVSVNIIKLLLHIFKLISAVSIDIFYLKCLSLCLRNQSYFFTKSIFFQAVKISHFNLHTPVTHISPTYVIFLPIL